MVQDIHEYAQHSRFVALIDTESIVEVFPVQFLKAFDHLLFPENSGEHPNLMTLFKKLDVNFSYAFSSDCFCVLHYFVSFGKILLVLVEIKI